MRLPVAAEYAIRGIAHIAKSEGGDPVTVRRIAAAERIPPNYLIKIFKSLVAAGLIRPQRGKRGGFCLAADPHRITLRRIIEAIQGPICFNDCLLRPGACPADDWCAAHPVWQRIQKQVCKTLDSVTLAEIAAKEAGRFRGEPPEH
jgi:Rrf2 family protein